jgi:GNAT superfamily N-acetyltransferase
MQPRPAIPAEVDVLARLWFDGWQDAHAAILPADLARMRTLESFGERLRKNLADVRAIGPAGAPTGFSLVEGCELNQLYVCAEARGQGAAQALVADAEATIAARGHSVAWLACAIGNQRAARFYEKCGWRLAGTQVISLDTPSGDYPLSIWRYEKRLG